MSVNRPTTYSKALASLAAFNQWVDSFARGLHATFDKRFRALSDALIAMENRSETVYPTVTSLSAAAGLMFPIALTGLTLSGTGLLNGSTKATGATANSAGKITFTSVIPGERSADVGNQITITITNDESTLGVTASASSRTITIVHGDGVASAAAVVAAVNAHATAKYMVTASVTTAGNMDADEEVVVENTYRAGVLGDMKIGAVSLNGATSGCGITSWTDTAITFDFDASALTVGDAKLMRVRANNLCISQLPLQVSNTVKVSVSVAAESSNARTATITVKDLAGNTIAATTQLHISLRRATGVEALVAAFTMTDGGAGAIVGSTSGPILYNTNSSGVAEVVITDVAGNVAETLRLHVRAVGLPCAEIVTDVAFA